VRRVRTLSTLLAAGLVVAACGSDADSAATGSEAAQTALTVFAAASLKPSFTTLGDRFRDAHPGTSVRFSFAGSADLLAQLQAGAPADVFASADTATMDKATGDDLLAGPATAFASNTLQIAVPPDNPGQVATFADLTKPGLQVVVCAPQVPCGSATEKVERSTGITLQPASEESSVADVLAKVSTGQADAGLVYVTDVRAAGDRVRGVSFPEARSAVNVYPIAVLAGSGHADLARAFVDLVAGVDGQQVLAEAGFGRPTP
jgi:molybdate transport system substrate-binding protein